MTNGEKYKTAQERAEAFRSFCLPHVCHDCQECKVYNGGKGTVIDCVFAWLDLEAEEEKPLPCPFCGSLTFVDADDDYYVQCEHCGYRSANCFKREDAIAAHNRVAKKCMEGKE